MERVPSLKRLGRLACLMLAHPAASSWSERIFSYAGEQSSGKRSSTSIKRLNIKEVMKFNQNLLPNHMFDDITKRLPDVLKQPDARTFGFPLPNAVPREGKGILTTERACIYCVNVALEMLNITDATSGVVSCDGGKRCPLNGAKIGNDNVKLDYYGCKNCDDYDLCLDCYILPENVIPETAQTPQSISGGPY